MHNKSNSITTGTYLLAILQDRYNHHQRLADSYESMAKECTEQERKDELLKEYKFHHEQATAIYCDVNKLDLLEDNNRAHITALRQNYEVHKRMKDIE